VFQHFGGICCSTLLLKRLGVFPAVFFFPSSEKSRTSMEGSPERKHLPAILSWCAAESYVRETGKSMKAVSLVVSKGLLLKNLISDNVGGVKQI